MIFQDSGILPSLPLAADAGIVLGLAYIGSAVLQPLVRRAAVRRGILDRPDGERRKHQEPIPRLGGVGVFAALLFAGAVGGALDSSGTLLTLSPFVIALGAAGALLFAVGLIDDVTGVRPLVKLVVQSGAALIVWRYGFRIETLLLPPSYEIALGILALPVTVIWIVGLSNAFNLVDGADGLAGGVALVALTATAISAAFLGDTSILWCTMALAGAMMGFLRYNLPPARIFLGDSGSLVVGFLLAVLTVKGMSRADGAVYALGPVFALSYPLLDTGISIIRRWLRGDPLSRADGRHIHHQLQALGLGPRQMLAVLYGLSSVIAILGISATFAPPHLTIAVAIAGGLVLLAILVMGTHWLQYHELLEAGASLGSVAMHGRARLKDKIHARDLARVIAVARGAEELEAVIEDSAETFGFAHMQLRRGISRETPPAWVVADMLASHLWAFDYPIVTRASGQEPLFLSVWCRVDGMRPAGAQRVAQILAPALQQWLDVNAERLSAASFKHASRRGRREDAATVGRCMPADYREGVTFEPARSSSGRSVRV